MRVAGSNGTSERLSGRPTNQGEVGRCVAGSPRAGAGAISVNRVVLRTLWRTGIAGASESRPPLPVFREQTRPTPLASESELLTCDQQRDGRRRSRRTPDRRDGVRRRRRAPRATHKASWLPTSRSSDSIYGYRAHIDWRRSGAGDGVSANSLPTHYDPVVMHVLHRHHHQRRHRRRRHRQPGKPDV